MPVGLEVIRGPIESYCNSPSGSEQAIEDLSNWGMYAWRREDYDEETFDVVLHIVLTMIPAFINGTIEESAFKSQLRDLANGVPLSTVKGSSFNA